MPLSKGVTEQLVNAVTSLTEAVSKLNEKLSLSKMEESQIIEPQISNSQTFDNTYPVPIEYRQAIDTILNKDFGISILPLSDSPAFQFHLVVPPKYSNASAEYLKLYKGDVRPKVITYSDGLIGVRNWCEMVYNSFNPTIQAQIVADRTK